METHHQNEHEQKHAPDGQTLQEWQELLSGKDTVAPGVPIVRASTPRPISLARPAPDSELASGEGSFTGPADFPVVAPAAPPLPEELEEDESGAPTALASLPLPVPPQLPDASPPEFTWLFEYGLEMESAYLNTPNRLNGLARIYGPAVLKGYRIQGIELQHGRAALTLVKDLSPEQEVWGILYRIPQRLVEQRGQQPSELDNAHTAPLFTAHPVIAEELYRKRQVHCITYMLSEAALDDQASFWPDEARFDAGYVNHLLKVGRQQKLPEAYLEKLATLAAQGGVQLSTNPPQRTEQTTEPLPVITGNSLIEAAPGNAQISAAAPTANRWFFALAFYLVALLMATLTLAVVQALGYWSNVFNASFAPLGAPWYMLLYGLLGGCISCIMTLGKRAGSRLPGFVILTWFIRPYLGAVLAALAYLALTSGLFALSNVPEQRYAICSIIGSLVGLCEGWLFFRKI